MSGLIPPKIELDRAFMPVLVTSKFDHGSIKNERASMVTRFSHYKSIGIFLDAQGFSGPIWLKFELVRDFMHVFVIAKYKKDRIKSTREKMETPFSPV